MDAVLSGQAKRAVLIDGDNLSSFCTDAPEKIVSCEKSDMRLLFGEAQDLRFVENVDKEQAKNELAFDYSKRCSLDLVLLLLDEEISSGLKREVVEVLEEVFEDERLIIYLESIFFARPLMDGVDIEKALNVSEKANQKTHNFLLKLQDNQDGIGKAYRAWKKIPNRDFVGESTRDYYLSALVQEGVFRELVPNCNNSGQVNSIHVEVALNKSFTSLPNNVKVLQELFSPFKQNNLAH